MEIAAATIDVCFMQIAAMQKLLEEQGIASFDAAAKKAKDLEMSANACGKEETAGSVYMTWEEWLSNLAESAKSAELLASLFKAIAMAVCTNDVGALSWIQSHAS
jgi:hypothetical protein